MENDNERKAEVLSEVHEHEGAINAAQGRCQTVEEWAHHLRHEIEVMEQRLDALRNAKAAKGLDLDHCLAFLASVESHKPGAKGNYSD